MKKRSTTEIEKGQLRFQELANQTAVGIVKLDLSGIVITCNPKFCALVGYPEADLVEQNIRTSLLTDDPDKGLLLWESLTAGKIETYNIENRFTTRHGGPLWTRLTFDLIRNPENGSPAGCLLTLEDISDLKSAQAAVQQKEDYLQSIYQGVEEAIFVVEVSAANEYTFAGFNPSYLRLSDGFGVDMREMHGKTTEALHRYFPAEAIQHLNDMYTQCATSGKSMEYEESVIIDGKLTFWHTRLAPLRGLDGKTFRIIGTSANVTSQKEAMEKVRTTEEHLRQAQKMEAVGRLAGGIAHDFNNLLTAINGYGDLLLARSSLSQQDHGFIREIRKAGERAASLTNQLLTFSRKQMVKNREVDLNAIVMDMGNLLKRLIGEEIKLEVKLSAGLDPILADPGQIEQVILNLAINARDALPKGGHLTLETSSLNLPDPILGTDKTIKSGLYAVLVVSDDGRGMNADTCSHIFEPFFTTKPAGEGTGLGLSTVYGIVAQAGGDIQVTSQPDIGTVFKIFLPIAAKIATKQPIESEAKAVYPSRRRETILVAEDEEVVRKLVTEVLAGAGYKVVTAANGVEALRAAHAFPGKIDLLLTDLVMGEMGGRELAENMQARMPHVKLIYMSGYTDDTVARHGILEFKTEFLQKPFSAADLLYRIRIVLDSLT